MKNKKELFIGCFNKSVILTYIGNIFAIIGILLLMDFNKFESIDRIGLVMPCLIICGICDLFDGFIARKCKRTDIQKAFGVQIDTLSDIISFVIFPAIILYRIATRYNSQIIFIISMIIIVLYVICGITRLAWFNMLINNENIITHYQGLPVTYIAFAAPIMYAIIQRVPVFLNNAHYIFAILYTIIGLLFVLNIKIKKPIGKWYIIFSIIAIITFVLLLI